MARPTFARINLDAIVQNCRTVKELVGGRRICAAVKADGYGHGAPAVARAMSAAGVDMFAVAMTEEAVELRQAGISRPIILLTSVPPADIPTILAHSVTPAVCEESFAERLSQAAIRRETRANVHVNIDTGMRRVGLPHEQAAQSILRINRLPGIRLTGLFTHFACSDDVEISTRQLRLFRRVMRTLRQSGMALPMLHVANSTATLQMPEAYLDCVRPGLILYGMRPPDIPSAQVELAPALSLHTEVAFCKRVPPQTPLGYGHTFCTDTESTIATLPIGYHDGYLRQYSNRGEVLVRGQRAPVVGRVCMDQTLVDVTGVPGVQAGDEVVIYGRQQANRVSIEQMAGRLGCIPYELTCSVGGRVRRQYVLDGKIIGETPMRSLVPRDVLEQIFRATEADETSMRKAARLGAA